MIASFPTVLRLINAIFSRFDEVVVTVREVHVLSGLLIFAMAVGATAGLAVGISSGSFLFGLVTYSLAGTAVMVAAMIWVAITDTVQDHADGEPANTARELDREAA